MAILSAVIPTATLLALALLTLLPWGAGDALRFLLPTLPYVAVHFWMRDHSGLLPPAIVFATALAIDVMTFGPLGYWPLVYIAGAGSAALIERLAGRLDGIADWVAFAAASGVMSCVGWGLASAYFARYLEPWPMLVAWSLLLLAWPLAVALLTPLERIVAGPRVLNLDRRS